MGEDGWRAAVHGYGEKAVARVVVSSFLIRPGRRGVLGVRGGALLSS